MASPEPPRKSIDSTSAPPASPPDPEFGYLESPEFVSATVTIPAQPYAVHFDSVAVYPSPVIASLTKGGSAESYGISPVGSVGALGYADACGSSKPLWSWAGNAWFGCGGPAIGLVRGTVYFGYDSFVYGLAPSNDVPCWGQQFTGDLSYPDRCTNWSGSFNGTITRLPADLAAAPDYQVIEKGALASVTFGPSPATLPVYDFTPFDILRMKFEPEDSSKPLLDCQPIAGGCVVRPEGPGMVHIVALVNGRVKRKDLYIDMQQNPNKLLLRASPISLPNGGGDVTFTAFPKLTTKFWGVTGWAFQPDSGASFSGPECPKESSVTECTERITRSGTMTVYGYVPGVKPDSASQRVEVLQDSLPPDSLPPSCARLASPTSGAFQLNASPDCVPSTPKKFLTVQLSSTLMMRPEVHIRVPGLCVNQDYDSRRGVVVRVTKESATGLEPVEGETIGIEEHAIQNDGGHIHAGKAPGFFEFQTSVTDENGEAHLTYRSSEFSGRFVVTFSVAGAEPVVDTITVGIPSLVELPAISGVYNRIGDGRDTHPDAYNGERGLINALSSLAEAFYQEFGRRLEINDMSLPLGGRFDLNANWSYPHCDHRYGTAADVRTYNLTDPQRKFLKAKWKLILGNDSDAIIGVEGAPPHYHMKIR